MSNIDYYRDVYLQPLIRVADVFVGGDSRVPLPRLMHQAATKVQDVLSLDLPFHIPNVNLTHHDFALALLATIIPPLVWNIIGPFQYYTRIISRLTIKPIIGVYLSALIITTLSVIRSAIFIQAMRSQVTLAEMDTPFFHVVGGIVGIFGVAMFLGAFYQLGIAGTYLGDYFGILREEKITAFPFSILNNPMYDGQSMIHLAEAIFARSPAGVLLAGWLFFCYRLGCAVEEPFTEKMYRERDEQRELARREKLKQAKSS